MPPPSHEPEVVPLHPINVYSSNIDVDTKESTVIEVAEDATVADVIESALENFSIPASSELFDLYEVFKEFNSNELLSTMIEKGRLLVYSECPVQTVSSWSKNFKHGCKDVIPEEGEVFNENSTCCQKGESRLYLVQKSEDVSTDVNDIKVTWLDGLDSSLPPEEWHFDPYYRGDSEIDDLVNLPVLNEKVILNELFKRFCLGRIYTYIGGILVAINPFKYFPIYNPKYVKAYQHRKLGELPPHVFAIADSAYNWMLQEKTNQCIVISGESGSGKTESTKLILHHLTALSHKTKATVLEKTILAAGPVLEAFGNAKTCHNNNSSRFGKFTQINYRADGVVCGAVQKKYLLEKSRIVSQSVNERNYHVFYYLLAGASAQDKDKLNLGSPQQYHYLNQTSCYSIDSVDEAYEYVRLKHAIKNIGICSATQLRMFGVLSAVLHIGNITFKKRGANEDAVFVSDDTIIDTISKLLQVEKQDIIQPLTLRKTITRGEEFVRFYKNDEAVATRDSMAKCLYTSLFEWIVLQTNHKLVNRQAKKNDKKAFSIGVLDIFGFEDFESNGFEQFCINLANESLQFYLNQHIFKLRQDEYIEEGLAWDHVDYVDNATCLNLIVGKPTGLILLLDEECRITMGTDKSLLAKFNEHHATNAFYEMPPTREPVFSVIHYAGKVKYQIKHFRAKNRDLMRSDITTAFKNSQMLFVRELMGSDPVAIYYWSILRHMIKAISLFKMAGREKSGNEKMFLMKPRLTWAGGAATQNRKQMFLRNTSSVDTAASTQAIMREANKVMKRRVFNIAKTIQSPSNIRSGLAVKRTISGGMNETYRARGTGLKSPPTVVAQFQSSLQELMDTLNQSHPLFVRCVRSNAKKSALEFDAELVLRQLRYTGMLETVKIRQAGYPGRISLQAFIHQFKVLFPEYNTEHADRNALADILVKIGLNPKQFQVGMTKVFMRESQYQLLRTLLQRKCDDSARKIQNWYLTCHARQQFCMTIKAILDIQRIWRGYKGRRDLENWRLQNMAALHILDFWRYHRERSKEPSPFTKYKKATITIQSYCRGYLSRKKVKKMLAEKQEVEEQKEIIILHPISAELTKDSSSFESGLPYTSHRLSRNAEKSEHLMNELFKDTIFKDQSDVELSIDGLDNIPMFEKSAKIHEYAEIDDFNAIFGKGDVVPESKEANKMPTVKPREHDEKLSQKIYRRLSFSGKEKIKSNVPAKKFKEAEDQGFEIITPDMNETPKKIHISGSTKTTFAGLFSTLQRRGSKRVESPMKEKRRRSANIESEYVVKGEQELEVLNEFLMKKVTSMNKHDNMKGDSGVDTVFKNALHKYHGTLLFTCANASVQRNETIILRFDYLLNGFQEVLSRMVNQEESVSEEFSTIGCNLFQGIIEEFIKQKEKLLIKRRQRKPVKRKRRKTAEFFDHNGHLYMWQNFNIRTYCEFCNSFIYERGVSCQACSFTCHKKCHTKYQKQCKGRRPSVCGPSALFGTDLSEITSPNNPIPEAIIKLIQEIEKKGLFTPGLYRKPGLQAAVNNLKCVLTSTDADDLIFADENPSTLASVLKLFFRQLPKPVVCDEFYGDFLRSTDLETDKETQATLYDLVQRFPKANKELFERIIVHLSRVAMQEETNRMSPNSLAIIWAPCLMRACNDSDPLETLKHLPKQTKCIEVMIEIHLETRRLMVDDIGVLHRATSTAEKRIEDIMKQRLETTESDTSTDGQTTNSEEIEMLQIKIQTMDDEIYHLTSILGNLEPQKSQSLNSLDQLESEFVIVSDSAEELHNSTPSNDNGRQRTKNPSDLLRSKFIAGLDYDSSFEEVLASPKHSSDNLRETNERKSDENQFTFEND